MSKASSGWMLTLRPLALVVHCSFKRYELQVSLGKWTTPPGTKGNGAWAVEAQAPWDAFLKAWFIGNGRGRMHLALNRYAVPYARVHDGPGEVGAPAQLRAEGSRHLPRLSSAPGRSTERGDASIQW